MISRSTIKSAGWEEIDNFFDKEQYQRIAHLPDFKRPQEDGTFNIYLRDDCLVIERYKRGNTLDPWSMSSWERVYKGNCNNIFDLRALENLLDIK